MYLANIPIILIIVNTIQILLLTCICVYYGTGNVGRQLPSMNTDNVQFYIADSKRIYEEPSKSI